MESISFAQREFDPRVLHLMITHLVRCEPVLVAAKGKLDLEAFDRPSERAHAMIWRIASEFYEANRRTISEDFLMAKAEQAMLRDPEAFPGSESERVRMLVRDIFLLPEAKFFPKEAIRDVQEFLHERKFKKEARLQLELGEPDMMSRITKLHDSMMVEAADVPTEEPFMKERFGTSLPRFCTGVDYLDEVLSGLPMMGMGGLLGGTGGGKTTMAVEVVTRYPMNYEDARTMLLSYETSLEGDIFDRIYSVALEVPTTQIANKTIDELPESLQHKFALVRDMIQDRVSACSMVESRGAAGAEEIRIVIDDYAQKKGAVPNLVWVDWVQPVAEKMIASDHRMRNKELRQAIMTFCNELLPVALDFKTLVVTANQLNATACSKGPIYKPMWTDSAESKSFGNLMQFMLAIGMPDDNGIRWLNCSKNRGAALQCYPVKLLGAECKFQFMSPEMTISRDGSNFYDPSMDDE